MSDDTKIVIVGAGAAGLSTAMHLARRGCTDVTVIERGYPAEASSGLSVGVFTRQYFKPRDIRMRVEAYELLLELERDHGLVLIKNGFARLAHDQQMLEEFEQGAELQRRLGVEDSKVLDRDELAKVIPDMDCTDIEGGILTPSDGYMDGQQLCMKFAEIAQAKGVELRVKTALEGYSRLPGGGHRLDTSKGELECDVVVNAAGAWAPAVGEILDAPVSIRPERHQACIFELEEPLSYQLPTIMDYMPESGEMGLYLRPEGERQIVAGLHTNEKFDEALVDADDYFAGVEAEFVDELIPMLAKRMPGLSEMGLREGWAGIYPNSPDDDFIIGPQKEGIFAACGLNGVGVYTSPFLGKLAAEWIMTGAPSDPDLRALSPERFAAEH